MNPSLGVVAFLERDFCSRRTLVVVRAATIMPGWAAALIIGGAMLASSAIIGYIGWRRTVTNPLALTRQTLKEDMRWVKERLA